MKRPIGVTLVALLLVASSFLTLSRALTPPGARLGQKFVVFCVLSRLPLSAGQGIRLMAPILIAGFVSIVAALYLRRVV